MACHEHYMEQYHMALCNEISLFANLNAGNSISTIYFGGGTPSTYPAHLLLDISGRIREVFNCDMLGEVTIEVNPGTVSEGLIDSWVDAGINRLSVGVQYGDDVILSKLNRHQKMADVYKLFKQAEQKIQNISVDVMLGLPGVDRHQWKNFMAEVVKWPIQHISLYCLMVHENTPLYFEVERKKIQLPDDEFIGQLYCWSVDFLGKNGFFQYEVSNFARQGYESKHNSVYWDRKPYKGFGLGACSFDGMRRFTNESNLTRYCLATQQGTEPVAFAEELTVEQIRMEKIMLGLRRIMGIHYQILLEGVSPDRHRIIVEKINQMCAIGLLEQDDFVVRMTPAGFIVEQQIIAQLV